MTTHTRLRIGAVALVLLVVVLLGGSHLCEVARDAGSRPLSTGALACTEFWFNRYQTLIGAMAALIAAGIAWIGIGKQLQKTDLQIAAATRQSAIAILPILDQRIESAIKTFRIVARLNDMLRDVLRASQLAFVIYEDFLRNDRLREDKIMQINVTDRFKEYKDLIEAFCECTSVLNEEVGRGLGGPIFRKAGTDIATAASNILHSHRYAFGILEENMKNSNEIVDGGRLYLQLLYKFDREINNICADSAPILAKEFKDMQSERDIIFAQSLK